MCIYKYLNKLFIYLLLFFLVNELNDVSNTANKNTEFDFEDSECIVLCTDISRKQRA